MIEGFLIVNKPKGITSFGVVSFLRKITKIKKIGHCGTLDPLASGVLVCALGRSATKRIHEFREDKKEYIAEIEFGKTSDTYDLEGKIKIVKFKNKPKIFLIKKELKSFIGETIQVPPIFSAKKIKGVRSYELARKGIKPDLKGNKIFIYDIRIISYKWPLLKLKIICGKGTYIRSLANDIGERLFCGALLKDLKRTMVGKFDIKNSIKMEKINKENWKDFINE